MGSTIVLQIKASHFLRPIYICQLARRTFLGLLWEQDLLYFREGANMWVFPSLVKRIYYVQFAWQTEKFMHCVLVGAGRRSDTKNGMKAAR